MHVTVIRRSKLNAMPVLELQSSSDRSFMGSLEVGAAPIARSMVVFFRSIIRSYGDSALNGLESKVLIER
jgi:hypothetical protein